MVAIAVAPDRSMGGQALVGRFVDFQSTELTGYFCLLVFNLHCVKAASFPRQSTCDFLLPDKPDLLQGTSQRAGTVSGILEFLA
jgi:hypothetical protein